MAASAGCAVSANAGAAAMTMMKAPVRNAVQNNACKAFMMVSLCRSAPMTGPITGRTLRRRRGAPRLPGQANKAAASAALMAVEADALEMAEQRRKPVAIRLRQRRLEQRGDVAAQVRGVAGAEQR